ncbi:NACHT domain-containing protein [Streptomyces sp. FXJ1.4098]|nr:NACHT domain-containing protein [Streptomyces sp. FXJ1.4098]
MVDGGHSLGSGDTVNIFNGDAEIVVQFRDIYGDIHLSAPPRPTPVERAAHALAEAVFRQWREEAKVWDVGGDRPALAVHWKPRTRRADHTENVGGTVRGQGDRPEDLLTAFLGLRQRRLAILGDAGSGKTALAVLLTLDLLRRRLTGGGERLPVPVLLSLASWVPDREEFGAWFTRRLAEDYPGLPRVEGRHPARELWSGSASVLLPVLDGLDEMPGERRSTAVKALNRALYDGRPLILTCRTAEFDGLWSEVVLRSAAVIEARPIAVDEAVRYLTLSIAPKLLRRWDTVFAQISGRPDGAMATALSTPLMLWLARTVYAQEWTNPAELTEEARFPSRQSIENHLLDGFVPSVFTGEIPSDDRWEPPHRWSAVRARRYLHALARHLHQQRTTELAWWRLHRATAPRLLALPTLAVLGVLVSEAVTMLGRLFEGAGGVSPGITSQLGEVWWWGSRSSC